MFAIEDHYCTGCAKDLHQRVSDLGGKPFLHLWSLSEEVDESSDLGKSAEVEALENLPDSDIKNALQELPDEFRMAVYLADVEGFSYKEIAEIIDIPAGTVMSRLHRGRKLLREKLADYARELGYTVDSDKKKSPDKEVNS